MLIITVNEPRKQTDFGRGCSLWRMNYKHSNGSWITTWQVSLIIYTGNKTHRCDTKATGKGSKMGVSGQTLSFGSILLLASPLKWALTHSTASPPSPPSTPPQISAPVTGRPQAYTSETWTSFRSFSHRVPDHLLTTAPQCPHQCLAGQWAIVNKH